MKSRMALWHKFVMVAVAAVASLALVVTEADARAGRGGSIGSRGVNTRSAPPATSTAPKAAPIEKSATTTAAGAQSVQQASRFGGLKGLLLGGLIGAGLASLFGAGAFANILGFLLQMLLIGGLVFLVVSFFRNRSGQSPALATAAAGATPVRANQPLHREGTAGASLPPLQISEADFNAFERLLGEVQTAYGKRDLKSLETRTTPEMLSYFAGEIDQNSKQGLRNEISGGRLLQGDLAESWREAGGEYATVAMRYEITDAVVKIATGQVVSGSRTEPQEVTEIWTFWRPTNGNASQWELSAIQQAS